MSAKAEPTKRKKTGKKQRRALKRRRRLSLYSALAAAVLLALAVWSRPRLSMVFWGVSALGLGALTALLRRRRGFKRTACRVLCAACALLAAAGVFTRGYVVADGAVAPVRTLAADLRITDGWPADIDRYTHVLSLDMRDSTVTDFKIGRAHV